MKKGRSSTVLFSTWMPCNAEDNLYIQIYESIGVYYLRLILRSTNPRISGYPRDKVIQMPLSLLGVIVAQVKNFLKSTYGRVNWRRK